MFGHFPNDANFVIGKINEIISAMNNEKEDMALATRCSRWYGDINRIRLAHAVIELKERFFERDDSVSREKLDSRNSPLYPQTNFWDTLAKLFNQPDFVVNTISCHDYTTISIEIVQFNSMATK